MIETIRKFLRPYLIGSAIWRESANLATLLSAMIGGNIKPYLKLRHLVENNNNIQVQFKGLEYPFTIRPNFADLQTVKDNLIRNEWGKLPKDFSPSVIVDAGAYIGDTAAYYASRFPNAKVIALEPNPNSAALARYNLLDYGERVVVIEAALWSTTGKLSFAGDFTGAGIAQTSEISVQGYSLVDLIKTLSINKIDLMKIDIEGAEYEVLNDGEGKWLNNVKIIAIELHGEELEIKCLMILRRNGFSCKKRRNVWYCERRMEIQDPLYPMP